jgi:Holliday junction resolvase RusA-like endonuclease
MTLSVFVPGDPKGQPRPRAFAFRGHARVYDAGTAEGWKSEIAAALKPWAGTMEPGAVVVRAVFYFRRPKGHRRTNGALRDAAPLHHAQKPDVDNLVKAVLDCGSGIGLWRDDCQVVHTDAAKLWAGDNGPGLQLDINTVTTPAAHAAGSLQLEGP